MRVSPAARHRLDHIVRGRKGAPQALWVRVEGSRVSSGTVRLALVDRPDPVPEGYCIQESWTVPILMDEAHAAALAGVRIEYAETGPDVGFRVRLPRDPAAERPPSTAPETGCVSCSSAALPGVEALRRAPGRAPSGSAGRGIALPVFGQGALAGVQP